MHTDLADDVAYVLACHNVATYVCATWRTRGAHVISD